MEQAVLGADDFTSLFRNLLPQYTPSYQYTQTSQLKPEEREKKIEEQNKTKDEAKKELKTAENNLEESKDAEKALIGKEFTASDAAGSMIKGALGMVSDLVSTKDEKGERHFSLGKTLLSAGVAAVAIAAAPLAVTIGTMSITVGGALAAAGVGLSAFQVAKGVSHFSNAKTFADKDAAVQEMAEGTVGAGLSVMGLKTASALKAAKNAQTAEGLVGATEGLTAVAADAGKASVITDVVKANGLTENAELLTLISDARQAGKPISVPDLFKAGVTDWNQAIKARDEINAALKTAETAGATTHDTGLISSINSEAGFLKAAGTDSKAANNAKQSLAALFKLTTREGITPEMEAALAKIKSAYPETAEALGLGSHQAKIKLINDMAGREQGIIDGLKGITGAGEKEKEIIEKATALLAKVNKGGADRAEVLATLKEVQGCESVSGPLEVQIISARKALATTAGQALKATGRKVVDGAHEFPDLLAGSLKRMAVNSKEEFRLNVGRVSNALPQASNQMGEAFRQDMQALQFTRVENDIKDKKEAVATATTKHETAVKELASLYKVDTKDSKGKEKSIKELEKAIIIAEAGEKAAKEVLAAAEKEKAAAKAAA